MRCVTWHSFRIFYNVFPFNELFRYNVTGEKPIHCLQCTKRLLVRPYICNTCSSRNDPARKSRLNWNSLKMCQKRSYYSSSHRALISTQDHNADPRLTFREQFLLILLFLCLVLINARKKSFVLWFWYIFIQNYTGRYKSFV